MFDLTSFMQENYLENKFEIHLCFSITVVHYICSYSLLVKSDLTSQTMLSWD